MAPSHFSSLICVATPSLYSLRSSCDVTLLRFPPMKSSKTLWDRAFMFAAPRLWNSLPRDIRATINLSVTLKMKLKTFLFSQVFHDQVLNFYLYILIYLDLFSLFLELLSEAQSNIFMEISLLLSLVAEVEETTMSALSLEPRKLCVMAKGVQQSITGNNNNNNGYLCLRENPHHRETNAKGHFLASVAACNLCLT